MPLPSSIAGLELWLEADAITAVDGDTPASWPDQSGNAFNAALTAAVFKAAILNGKPILRFDGSTAFGDVGAPSGLELYSAWTIATVFRTTGTGFIVSKDFSTGARGYVVGVSTSGHMYIETGGFPLESGDGPSVVDGVGHHAIVTYDGSALNTYLDGAPIATYAVGSFSANASAPWNVGRRAYVGVPDYFIGDVAAVLVYNSALGSFDRQTLTNYVAGKYALPGGTTVPGWWTTAGPMMGSLSLAGGR